MSKCRDGYRVIGQPSTGGARAYWYFDTLEFANNFAKLMAGDNGGEYDVCQYLGSWRRTMPVEFVPATVREKSGD